MTLDEALAATLTAAAAEGKNPGDVTRMLVEAAHKQALTELQSDLQSLTVAAPEGQWQAIRQTLIDGRDVPDRRDLALERIAEAVKTDNQADFWRAAVGLLVMVRASLPHMAPEFEEGT